MQELLRDYLGELRSKRRKRRRISVAVTLLIVMVAGGVIGALVQYGVAMTGDAKCGIEEHTHSDECYENVLVCGQEESEGHTHTDACYQTNSTLACGLEESEEHVHGEECYVNEQVLICGQEEGEGHTHTDSCYDKQLACGKEEHIHTDACYIDTTADVEESSDWDAQYKDTEWKDAWGEDLVTAAKVQVGYKESTKNYTVAADESHKGYTRYGQFAGDVYADWDAMFVNFCMHYAGLEDLNLFPNEKTAVEWYNKFVQVSETNLSYITAPEGYEPKVGDLIFFNKEEENEFRMGVVSSYNKEKNEIKVIEGNSENEVKENEYDTDDEYIYAYLKITELETAYKDKGEEDSSPEETEEPADGEEQDPQDEITEEEGDPQEEIAEEEEELQDEKTEEEEWAYEESYDADKVIVHVKAKEGVIPEGAELSVTPIEKKEITSDMSKKEKKEAEKVNEQYEMTNEKLNEESEKNEQKLEGFLAYDICFLVDGKEVEPDGEVKVAMDFKEAMAPEGVSENATVAINHLKESKNGGVKVENLTEDETTTIKTAEKDMSVEKVELVANEFSVFTITWQVNDSRFSEPITLWEGISVRYVDENRIQLEQTSEANPDTLLNDGVIYKLEDKVVWEPIKSGDKVYVPTKVYLNWFEPNIGYHRDEVDRVESYSDNGQWYLRFYQPGNSGQKEIGPFGRDDYNQYIQSLEIVCQPADFELEDRIEEEGNLVVKFEKLMGEALEKYNAAVEEEKRIECIWYKSINNGRYEPVDKKTYGNGTVSNISTDRLSLNVALDDGAKYGNQETVKYKAALKIVGEEEPFATTAPFSVPYYKELQNGSFEEVEIPSVSPTYNNHMPEQDVRGWKTTAVCPDHKIREIEVANVGIAYNTDGTVLGNRIHESYYSGGIIGQFDFEAADGNKFAELNAEAVGSLYQDVLVAKGTELKYSFYHRARSTAGSDKKDFMYLVIIPTFVAKNGIVNCNDNNHHHSGEIDTQEEVRCLLNHRNDRNAEGKLVYPGLEVKEYSAGIWKWEEHSGKYVPKYDLNRFFFVSNQESTPTMGNFIDKVRFSQYLPTPDPDKFNFTIEKAVEGVEEIDDIANSEGKIDKLKEMLRNLSFEVTVQKVPSTGSDKETISLPGIKDNVVSISDMKWVVDNNGTVKGEFPILNADIGSDIYEITVTEKNAGLSSYGYDLETSVTKVSSGVYGDSNITSVATTTVRGGSSERMLFTNTYNEEDNSTWEVVKRNKNIPDEKISGAEFTLTKKGDTQTEQYFDQRKGTSNDEGIVSSWTPVGTGQIGDLNGVYILSEIKAPTGYEASNETWELTFMNGKLNGATSIDSNKDKKDIQIVKEENVYRIYIDNTRFYSLPSTGGSGVYWYMFSGILLMAGTALITYKKRCREVLRS